MTYFISTKHMVFAQQSRMFSLVALTTFLITFSGCVTPKKYDEFVAKQYNNQLPNQPRNKAGIAITPLVPNNSSQISTTIGKNDRFLPLLVYWRHDYRKICLLNTNIALANFSNAVNSLTPGSLVEKMNGEKLELVVEQAPSTFALVTNEHTAWLLFVTIGWTKNYIEPDLKDLVVSYKLGDGADAKTGRIVVKNPDTDRSQRTYAAWKVATSEYLAEYDASITTMTKTFVDQLVREL